MYPTPYTLHPAKKEYPTNMYPTPFTLHLHPPPCVLHLSIAQGVKEYLEYVRTSGKYESEKVMSTLEYRDDTPDALEVSVCL